MELSFASFTNIRRIVLTFAQLLVGKEESGVIQLTYKRIDSILQKIDKMQDKKAFDFIKDLTGWDNDTIQIFMAFIMEKARPLLLGRRALLLDEKMSDAKIQGIAILNEKLSVLYTERRTFEVILAGNEVSDLDFSNNNYQEQAILLDAKIREVKEQITAML